MQALIHNRFKTAMVYSGIPGLGVILRAILGPGGPVQTGSAWRRCWGMTQCPPTASHLDGRLDVPSEICQINKKNLLYYSNVWLVRILMFLREVSYQGCIYLIKNTLKQLYCDILLQYASFSVYFSKFKGLKYVPYKRVKYFVIVYYFLKWLLQNTLNCVHSLVKHMHNLLHCIVLYYHYTTKIFY